MNVCMEAYNLNKDTSSAEKPLISIVLATYNPRLDWFKEQLDSLERQTYRPLELLIMDDCSSKVSLDEISQCVEDSIKSIPYQMLRNEENFGSTKTFEKLTILANGEYIAYCDQDDVWHEDKLEMLLSGIANKNVCLVYSDVEVIDKNGQHISDSIRKYRDRHILYEGSNLTDKLIIQNCVIGCTMLISRRIAQAAVPFAYNMVHDHYLAVLASFDGEIKLCKKPLVSYRVHSFNQTNTLTGITNKSEYYQKKILKFFDMIKEFEIKEVEMDHFKDIKKWAIARDSFYRGNLKSAIDIWKYRSFDFKVSVFEMVMLKMPPPIFRYALKMIKEGKV